ncbi:hypothetical protein FYK55_11945 [Roseiconus nitratireducens]|uniref:Glycosyl transferase family 2 n=1 Tax=Roseiconus nitratireducens TaxID=2605748 RepID=A0A5M6DC24_9BACT|nr:hypothetical protein [Roseiconus nitratireducens]KAA5543872.1 hypothetical protein FYK55_11945 [Roseiconus nitratireducens]
MPNFPRVPRASILVPFQRDEVAFEETLISVLENQPGGCEVIVAHNGGYHDPFDLADEVKFVVARSSNLVDLIRDGFQACSAQFVHVIGSGLTASPGWLSEGLQPFENPNVASVTPAIIDRSVKRVLQLGWTESPGRLCESVADSRWESPQAVNGSFLNACLLRRSVLGSLLDAVAPAMNDPIAVGYAFGCLLHHAGWSTVPVKACQLGATANSLLEDESDGLRGQTLSAVRQAILGDTSPLRLSKSLFEALVGNGSMGEVLGSVRYRSLLPRVQRGIDAERVATFDADAKILKLPSAAGVQPSNRRLAA